MISPQIGDVYYYIQPSYENFVTEFFHMLNFDKDEIIWPSDSVPEINNFQDGYMCKVIDIDYKWPYFRTKTSYNNSKKVLTAFAILTLQSTKVPEFTFKIRYFPTESYQFLIFHKYYEHKLEMFEKTNAFS